MLARFKDLYKDKIKDSLQKEFSFTNVHEIPRLLKVVINMGVGEAVTNSKSVDLAHDDLKLISGQKPVITKAKKSVSGFKIREGMNIGCKVTLRGERMYEFLERMVIVALPRIREFRGFSSKSFDSRGNFTFGIKEHSVFPEIGYGDHSFGMDVTIVTSARDDKSACSLLEGFHIPFYK